MTRVDVTVRGEHIVTWSSPSPSTLYVIFFVLFFPSNQKKEEEDVDEIGRGDLGKIVLPRFGVLLCLF